MKNTVNLKNWDDFALFEERKIVKDILEQFKKKKCDEIGIDYLYLRQIEKEMEKRGILEHEDKT